MRDDGRNALDRPGPSSWHDTSTLETSLASRKLQLFSAYDDGALVSLYCDLFGDMDVGAVVTAAVDAAAIIADFALVVITDHTVTVVARGWRICQYSSDFILWQALRTVHDIAHDTYYADGVEFDSVWGWNQVTILLIEYA